MDRQDAKPRRPSLLAGAPDPTAPSPARILADMAGNQPARARLPRGRRGWLLLAAAGVLLVAVWPLWAPRGPADGTAAPLLDRQDAAGAAGRHASHSEPAAATIIDEREPVPAPASVVVAAGDRSADAATGQMVSPPASTGIDRTGDADPTDKPRASTGATNPFSPPRPAGRRASLPAQGRAQPALPARIRAPDHTGRDGPALLAILLHNIQAGDQAGDAGNNASGLDSLLQNMQAAQTAGNDRAPGPASAPRSQQIQANLRECPPPNTAKGLRCRQEICAVCAGRDPACPAL